MSFFNKNKRETKLATGNPYIDAHAIWMEMYGSHVHQAYVWRLVAIGCLLITLVSVYGNYVQANQFKVVPYVVQVDKLGRAMPVARADAAIPPPRPLIQAELAQVITSWRTVTADLDLQKRMVDRLSNFVTGAAQGFLTDWFAANNPYKTAKENKLVQVEIKGLPLPVSQNSWRVEWTETLRNHVGTFLQAITYEATLSIKIVPPDTDDRIIQNPGGIWVTEISYSKVLGAGSAENQEGSR
jgi:type IV secretion system protein VirB5